MGGAETTDSVLVRQTLAGDTEAFAVLHRRYYVRVYRIALARCGNVADAEDIASETFVRAIAGLSSFRFQSDSLLPWLARIATNLATDQGRRRAQVTFVSLDNPASNAIRALLDRTPGDVPDPHILAEQSEVQSAIRAAIAKLPPDQADAVLLRFGGDLPLKEIAHALNKSEAAIKSLLHRAIIGLRRQLIAETESKSVSVVETEEITVTHRRARPEQ